MTYFKIDDLDVEIFSDRLSMGQNAANDVSRKIQEILSQKEEINMIFAAAPSQNEFLQALSSDKSIEWERVNGFHMDEYVGLNIDSPQSFSFFLKEHIFGKAPFKNVFYLNGKASPEEECKRYAALLSKTVIDIVCLGIGENGHVAFNDPHVADFNDSQMVKIVDLDNACRMQQVHDKCFSSINEVPEHALTLTIPTLIMATNMFCIVPGKTKSIAVKNTICCEISEFCPATILRKKSGAKLYLDSNSASLIKY